MFPPAKYLRTVLFILWSTFFYWLPSHILLYLIAHYSDGKTLQFSELVGSTFLFKSNKSGTNRRSWLDFFSLISMKKKSYIFITSSQKLCKCGTEVVIFEYLRRRKVLVCLTYIVQIHTGIFNLHFSVRNIKCISSIKQNMQNDFMYITI